MDDLDDLASSLERKLCIRPTERVVATPDRTRARTVTDLQLLCHDACRAVCGRLRALEREVPDLQDPERIAKTEEMLRKLQSLWIDGASVATDIATGDDADATELPSSVADETLQRRAGPDPETARAGDGREAPEFDAVRFSYDLIEATRNDATGLNLEILVQQLYILDGHRASHTGGSNDGGADVTVDVGGTVHVVQCKSRNARNVTQDMVIKFVKTMRSRLDGARGVIVTNQSLTSGARQVAEDNEILVVDKDELREWVRSRSAELRGIEVVTAMLKCDRDRDHTPRRAQANTWNQREEDALRRAYDELNFQSLVRKPWSSLLAKIRADCPDALHCDRTATQLRDKAKSLNLG